MDLFHTACGAESPKKSLLARYNGNATVSKFIEAVDKGARTEEQLELFDICPQTGICFLKAEIALCCIHRLRLRGYAVVLQPLIPDFGYGYAVNRDRWLAKPSVRKASHGRLALLNGHTSDNSRTGHFSVGVSRVLQLWCGLSGLTESKQYGTVWTSGVYLSKSRGE